MVLCAGLGTRLRPITDVWPKPAVPLLGQPLLRYTLSTLVTAGIRELGINTFHLPEVMERVGRAEAQRAGLPLTISKEEGEVQGTGGGIRGLKSFLSDGPFVVMNGDVLFAVDLAPIIAEHLASKAAATMVLLPMPAGQRFAAVELDEASCVRRIRAKGPGAERLTPWHFTGVHVMNPVVFDFMSDAGPEDINVDVYLRMIEKGLTVRGHVVYDLESYWSDVGTPESYLQTHRDLLFGQVRTQRFGSADPLALPRAPFNGWAAAGQSLSDVKVTGPAWFGPHVSIGRGCRIGTGVSVGPGAQLHDGASLNRVAVLDGARVPGQHFEDAIIAPNAVVPAVVSH